MKSEENPDLKPKKIVLDPNSELPPDADLEERFNDFWKKNGASIAVAVVIAGLGVAGVQGWRWYQSKQEAEKAAAYAAAGDDSAKLAFAKANPGHALSGAALLEAADHEYASGEYTAAIEHYTLAAQSLAGTAFAERATLGLGISQIRAGQAEAGLATLDALAGNSLAVESSRAEAAYHAAVVRWERKDWTALKANLDLIDGLKEAPMWSFRAQGLRSRVPELAQLP